MFSKKAIRTQRNVKFRKKPQNFFSGRQNSADDLPVCVFAALFDCEARRKAYRGRLEAKVADKVQFRLPVEREVEGNGGNLIIQSQDALCAKVIGGTEPEVGAAAVQPFQARCVADGFVQFDQRADRYRVAERK